MKVYVINLNESGDPILTGDGKFLNLPIPNEPYKVRFVLFAWSKFIHHGSLWCNVPQNAETQFDRAKFEQYPLAQSKSAFGEDLHVDITIHSGGPYSCYLTYDEAEVTPGSIEASQQSSEPRRGLQTAKFHFIVSTGFSLNGKPLSLNSLAIQSVLSKLMGPVDTWQPKLAAIKDKGYNMVHFTPLQQRGSSNSPFSIYDQLAWDPACFPGGESDIKQLVSNMEHQHGLLSLTDVVLNHTAHNSQWLREHPDAGYSVKTAPHLTPALDLDTQLLAFSEKLGELGLPTELHSIADLDRIAAALRVHVFDVIRLWEYYVVDVTTIVAKVMKIVSDSEAYSEIEPLEIPQEVRGNLTQLAQFTKEHAGTNFDRFGHGRFDRHLDVLSVVAIVKTLAGPGESHAHIESSVRRVLDEINEPLYMEYDSEAAVMTSQIYNRVKYTRLDGNGPKYGPITKEKPLLEPYFTRFTSSSGEEVALVNNGWVWGGNPLVDFATDKSRAYLRRDVIIWGDCVKLRYGDKPEDSPFLWEHMGKYAQLLAQYFHGFRIDNCHSTPLHVGEYFLDMARHIRPNLYVVAELFTGSEEMDRIFIERLGLTSLIREAMQAWSVQELSTLVNKNGGRPMGSFSKQPLESYERKHGGEDDEIHFLRTSPIHAWFMDCTHDNETAAEKRTVEDTLPNAALVAMCACAVGSTLGYDECYPHALNVVTETSPYIFGGGISKLKRILYDAHYDMGQMDADETFTHLEGQYITVHRVDPKTGEGYFLIARTKFYPDGDQRLSDVYLKGTTAECVLSVTLEVDSEGQSNGSDSNIKPIPVKVVELEKPQIDLDGDQSIVRLPAHFPQGAIALIKTHQSIVDADLDDFVREGAVEAVKELDLLDLNVLLYRCDGEELDGTAGKEGVYNVPGHGPLVYAGIQGWVSLLVDVVLENNLGHAVCDNLRAGNWAMDYITRRLDNYHERFPRLAVTGKWLRSRFERVGSLPPFLRPRYFALVMYTIYMAAEHRALDLTPEWIGSSTIFVRKLAMTSLQMVGKVSSASVFPFETVGSMAAGLPHFSRDYMRCWGRDVFISLPGLLLTLGRHQDAKNHILAFAATLKHGLIPNLLDSGRNPRYNARDATWFFLEVVQRYVKEVPRGEELLGEKVKRRFPLDDTYVAVDDPRAFSHESSIKEIVHEILSRHARGIEFREANAGPNLDSQMRDEGFNQKIYVDWSNGMIFGGNQWNCGTWMDKMGESDKAGSKGVPGTPRDGAAVEIIGLLKSALRFVNHLHEKGQFEWSSVINQHGQQVKLRDWEHTLQHSFERCFYVPLTPEEDGHYDVDPKIIHRRGIYKDLYRSGKAYEDYQLRPNFAIALVAAPELFHIDHALSAISVADKVIRGPVGMATLDPEDYNYRPYYNNGEDNSDFATSKGRNYHQGPEWVWCTGYFLRALLQFEAKHKHGGDVTVTLQKLRNRLGGLVNWLFHSQWRGLTELTNKGGQICNDSSPTQAWSSATLLELYADVRQLLNGHSKHNGSA